MPPDPPSPDWLDWGAEPFARAARRHQPVLLSLVAAWSDACAEMDRTTFADPDVRALADAAFVPVRVDADRRPDLAERYGLGAWPTTVFLGPEGAVLAGGTFVEPDRLRAVMRALAGTYARRETELRAAALQALTRPADLPAPADAPDATAPATLAALARERFDPRLGGFGPPPWHPPSDLLLLLALQAGRTGETALVEIALACLDALAAGLVDPCGGGVFRAAAGPGWQAPDTARLLDVNAGLLRAAAEIHVATGAASPAALARGVASYLCEGLRDREAGGFRLGQGSEVGWLTAPDRTPGSTPPVIDWRPVDANARACRALLRAAEALDDPSLAEIAVDALDRIVAAAYERGAGVAHVLDPRPRVRGLLADQVAASAALLEAAAVSGRDVYVDLAEELMRTALARSWDAAEGCFVDRLRTSAGGGDIGLLGRPVYPLAANAEAAVVLTHLARRRDDAGLAAHGLSILRTFATRWRAAGLEAAPYALAVLDVVDAQGV